ncbi:Capsule polysaccharide biosynthesis protein [Pleurostoma richardsiae]|uniref:Capsule polysaccharide biosynthesis protein n=1 Tax=Pleurostoma richardsiae TaxID=41990 RepID=A0AA38R1Y0_9PEZI|nr:Capsule polysaccharide biosynthesis protein [Pleurostoma richardsiae]
MSTYILGAINDSRGRTGRYGPAEDGPLPGLPSLQIKGGFPSTVLSVHAIWITLVVLFVAFNLKNLPFMWHLRIVNGFRFVCRSQRPKVPLRPSHIFQPIITTSSAQLMEIDFNIHKTNSSYFSDADIARTHLVCTLFSQGIEQMRGGSSAYTGSANPVFGLALGGVSCNFRREVRPFEQFEMWSRILAWDEKWVYIVTHFVRKDSAKPKAYTLYPQQGQQRKAEEQLGSTSERPAFTSDEKPGFKVEKDLFATTLSKCVFKSGRKTVSPDHMLRIAGLLPAEDLSSTHDEDERLRVAEEVQNVEAQRQRGLKIAAQLETQKQQQALEEEFNASEEVLGRHTDGSGIGGVVSTLLQLAHVKSSQFL